MKRFANNYPIISKYLFAFLLIAFALFISGLLNTGVVKQYFPYPSAICLLLATYILFKSENKSLNDLGLNFKIKNLQFFPIGIMIGALAFLIAKYLRAIYSGEVFIISETVSYKNIFYGFYTILPMVCVEELLFRGYLFKKTIEVSSVAVANIIFSILFLLVHVFDANVIHNLPIIIFTIITIPIGHLLFATALLKSKSLFFAIGIHLGNNWATRHLITSNYNGESFLYISNNARFDTWLSFIGFILIWNLFYLLVTYIIWKWNDFPFQQKKPSIKL